MSTDQKEMYVLRPPRPGSQHKRGLFAPEGQRARNKRQTRETEDREKQKETGERAGMFVPEGQRTDCL